LVELKKALEAGRFCLPDSDSLQADLVSVGYKYNSSGQLLLESKQDMRRRGVPSPDEADAVALCFSEPDGAPFVKNKDFYRELRDQYQGAYARARSRASLFILAAPNRAGPRAPLRSATIESKGMRC
jgi:hypothetical protein